MQIQNAGYNNLIFKSDQEPALKELLRAVKRERVETIELGGAMEEESPVGESASNGMVERAIQGVQAQMRTLKLALEYRYQNKIEESYPIVPWLVKRSAMTINVARQGEDGRTAYERRKGKRFLKEIPQLGECIWYLMPETQGVNKLDARWNDGLFLRIREESNELIVGTSEGVLKVAPYRRRPESERWKWEEMRNIKGTPWEPVPGRGGIEIKSKVTIPSESVPLTIDEGILLRPT